MVEVAAWKAPMSSRAQGQHAANLFDTKRYDESLLVIDGAILNMPNDASLRLIRTNILCKLGLLSDSDVIEAAAVVSAAIYDPRSIPIYTTLTTLVASGECPKVSLDTLKAMFTNMLRVPLNGDPESLRFFQIQYFIGYIDVHADRPSLAVKAFEASLNAIPGAGHAMRMAALMASNNFHDEALHLSDLALAQLELATQDGLTVERLRESDIREFRATVRADREAALVNDPSD
jgi:hypothetical protein